MLRTTMTTGLSVRGKPSDPSREEFINTLKLRFAHLNQEDTLKVFLVSDPLVQYCLTDSKYGVSTLPTDDKRQRHEEIAG